MKTSDSSEKHIAKFLDDLTQAVAALPLKDVLEHPIHHLDPPETKPDYLMEFEARKNIFLLDTQANLGNAWAVRALRDLGNLISNMLLAMALPSLDATVPETEKTRASRTCSSPEPKVGNHSGKWKIEHDPVAVIKLGVDFSGIQEIVRREVDTISKLNPLAIAKGFRGRRKGRIEISDSLKCLFIDSSASVGSGEGGDPLSSSRKRSLHRAFANRSEKMIHDFIKCMIERRVEKLLRPVANDTLLEVAMETLEWPVSVSAIQDKHWEIGLLLKSIRLGKSLPFRLNRRGKGGKNRNFDVGSSDLCALLFCVEMHNTRNKYATTSDKARDRMRRIDICLDKNSNRNYKQIIQGTEFVWNRHNHSTLKAALLPPFPIGKKKTSVTCKADLAKWHTVLISRIEESFFGDWELFESIWGAFAKGRPSDVRTRKKRSLKELYSEKLREAIARLI